MIRVTFTRSAIVLNVLRDKGDVVEYSHEEASQPDFLNFAKCHLGTPEEAASEVSHHIRGYVNAPVQRPAGAKPLTAAQRKAAEDEAAKVKAAADEAEFQRLLALEEANKQGAAAEAEALLKAAQGQ